MSTLGQRLKEERERLRLSQIDFAAVGGAKKHSQINYEADRTAPDTNYLSALSTCGADIVYILTGERGGVRPLANGGFEVLDLASSIAQLGRRAQNATAAEIIAQMRADELDAQEAVERMEPCASFVEVPVHTATLAAGDGSHNADSSVIAHLAFRKDWLDQIGVPPAAAVIARARGDSMAPTISDGDMLLIDTSRSDAPARAREPKDQRPARIFALLDNDNARVKRLELAAPGMLAILSDNTSVPPEFRPVAEVKIIGRVVWWGHTNRE